jgi:hypothetical protein
MTTKTTKPFSYCSSCGSLEFYVNESVAHKARIEDGALRVYKLEWASEFEGIVCAECSTDVDISSVDLSALFSSI